MILLNFAHPLTEDHLRQIEHLTSQKVDRVVEIPTQIDPQPVEVDMLSCKLIGSRARGDARPDSDWDVLVETTPPIVSNAGWFGELCVQVQKYEEAARAAAFEFLSSRPDYDGGEVDVFLVVNWGQTTLALLLEWDDVHCCYGGWLEPIPE